MKFIKIISCLIVVFVFTSWKNYSYKKSPTFRIAFYNLENLYDTINDLDVQDEEFTPAGKNQWTSERYKTKLNQMAKVISSMAPDFIGLAEIENKGVLQDLISNSQLVSFGYEIVHINSPDLRGIDVAFLYQKKKLSVIGYHTIHVSTDDTAFHTRDILQIEGVLPNKDSVCFFINHWPSRRGGTEQSEAKRLAGASALRTAVNQFTMKHPNSNVICMGDLNDNPNDKSVSSILKADSVASNSTNDLFNPMLVLYSRYHIGSLYYKGNQDLFDQIIVSDRLVEKNGGKEKLISNTSIYKPDWLFKINKYKENAPWRTFEGADYSGGYSDHCPVLINIRL
ncbi:endonuclease [Bacteroidota bacterium]|nr:endonuclease [Bacteroidota bacterium]